MSGKHRAKVSRSNLVVGSIAASVGVSSVLAAAIVELVSPESSPAAHLTPPAAQPQQPLTQQGRLIAVTPESLTTQVPPVGSLDGHETLPPLSFTLPKTVRVPLRPGVHP